METIKYRVGININKYINYFIIGCIGCFILGVLVASAFFMSYIQHIKETNTIILTEAEAGYNRKLEEATETSQEVINNLQAQVNTLTNQNEQLASGAEMDFNQLRKYWYVFKYAKADSGITLDVLRYLDEQCKLWNIEPDWMWGIYWHESNFRTNVNNTAGSSAKGLGQVLADSGRRIYENVLGHGPGTYNHEMANDPYVNIEITTAMIGRNLDVSGGNIHHALKIYSGYKDETMYNEVVSFCKNDLGLILSDSNVRYPS